MRFQNGLFLPASIPQMLGSHTFSILSCLYCIKNGSRASCMLPIENSGIFPTNTQVPSHTRWGWNPGLCTWLACLMQLSYFQPRPTEPFRYNSVSVLIRPVTLGSNFTVHSHPHSACLGLDTVTDPHCVKTLSLQEAGKICSGELHKSPSNLQSQL